MLSNLHACHNHCHSHCHCHCRGTSTMSMAATAIPLLLALLLGAHMTQLASALSQDGVLLLSFKFSLLADPLASLAGWGYADDTPCAWNGVVCMAFPESSSEAARVVSVVLPNAQLVGPIARELGLIEHLRHLDLSGNALNGTVPVELLRAPELRVLSLAGNGITGGLPEQVGQLRSLRALNIAGNALSGAIPGNLTVLPNLTAVSLANNYFSGALPAGGFPALQVLDVSSNLLNGTLPPDFGGPALRYVNLSSNRLAGTIPPEMASRLPANVTIDLSYNNLTGAIPTLAPFAVQRPTAFAGNDELCGRPLESICSFASTTGVDPPNGTARSPPAIAAIPKNPTESLPGGDTSVEAGAPASGGQGRMRLTTIIAIAAGDVAGIAVLFVVFMYVYQVRKKRQQEELAKQRMGVVFKKPEPDESQDGVGRSLSCCLRKAGDESDSTEEVTDTSPSFAAKEGVVAAKADEAPAGKKAKDGGAGLVTVDGDVELEMETLLKASAYILGSAGSSIVYKAVLANGAVLAVRRIGSDDAGVKRFSDFDAQMRAISRLRHGNILRLRGFYWGPDEMLLIHDFAANGSLANLSVKRKTGSSPISLGWSARLRIAHGVARGLAFLHDKKCVHGNVRPSNILLDADMEPLLADLGIHRLVHGGHRLKPAAAAGRFGSKRSAKSLPDLSPPPGASPLAGPSGSGDASAHYQSPEAVKNPKANAKWDVYSFGVMLLELVAGRALTSLEVCQWSSASAATGEENGQQVFRLADAALRGEMAGREEALERCLRLGFACCAMTPHKRPSMKDVVSAMDRIPWHSSSSSAQ
ncbi:hypothetical protein GUJ93_ZPchr0009g2402 [Zizania palustris]|uniref:Protein kinase domain-containing protein n=1 Tax=Zizania palustris TaxID=103762 RepID=A0A8J5RLT7_ZIZPA|nr:hypothetical protein GUJ93_ZPchr0009g2402 [Zizania palustris]